MNTQVFEQLHTAGLINNNALHAVKNANSHRLFSLHWEIKTLLYIGVLLLSGGLGVLIYKNIDTIGHQVILLITGAICAGSFFYCIRTKADFSWQQVSSPNAFFDYILLLGCLTFVTFIGYLQYQYHTFGTTYGLATFIPLAILSLSAYYFDHIGVLALAITNLAAWMGVSVTPLRVFSGISSGTEIYAQHYVYMALLLGGILLALALLSTVFNLKKHFAFTYRNFGAHIIFISSIVAMCLFHNNYFGWFLFLAAVAAYLGIQAFRERSFYFLLITVLYSYVGLSIVIGFLLAAIKEPGTYVIYIGLLYMIFSAIAVILLLIFLNKKLKHAGI
ncbi:DUF2157 domain-containing protein [Chitinophaga sp. 30R24]|uniref:DUF2157 domain-containing protein n=1 Tax=Chitinophaga sp. 30R24 TaxID=3248838 RepID=UPI003B9069E4